MTPENIARGAYKVGIAFLWLSLVTVGAGLAFIGWAFWPWLDIDVAKVSFMIGTMGALVFVAILNHRIDKMQRQIERLDRVLSETVRMLDGAVTQGGNARLEVTYIGTAKPGEGGSSGG